jgi:pyruvate/2-oxoglutarate/acetoin dehydrogenase E1 component
VRAVAAEGIGPVHSGVLHGIFMHFPGFRVCAPMTPGEYEAVWQDFMAHDDPMIVSEHRDSFSNTRELEDIVCREADITLFPISAARFEALKAAESLAEEGLRCNVVHILWLKPFVAAGRLIEPLRRSSRGLVIDVGHEIAGASQAIAYELTQAAGVPVKALGLMDKTKCLCPPMQNRYPDARRIAETVRSMVGR